MSWGDVPGAAHAVQVGRTLHRQQTRRPRGRNGCGGAIFCEVRAGGVLRAGGIGLPDGVLPEGSFFQAGRGSPGKRSVPRRSTEGSFQAGRGLLGPVAVVLHIGKGRHRGWIPGFPHDSGVLSRMSVSSGRAPMCRGLRSAHGRISTVLSVGAFPHDSADLPLAGPGRMCNTTPTGPLRASEPGDPARADDLHRFAPARLADPSSPTLLPDPPAQPGSRWSPGLRECRSVREHVT